MSCIPGWLTVKEAAEKINITAPALALLCRNGKVPGAVKFGSEWAIPETSVNLIPVRPPGWKQGRKRKIDGV